MIQQVSLYRYVQMVLYHETILIIIRVGCILSPHLPLLTITKTDNFLYGGLKFSSFLIGPAPQPPSRTRRSNPPTELEIPCEFCDVPIPHEDLIRHQTGCRPDLARFNPRRMMARSPSPDYYVATPPPSSPEVELPCEFCSDMIPASQLLRHQATCI